MPSRICKRMECVNLKTRAHANRPIGSCARLQLVFVHAENDTTMPWVETETLFKLTYNAALESISPIDGVPKNLKVVDLGEAGRQEVWQFGSKCIQKTIAKHGGKRNPPNPCSMWCALRKSCRIFIVAQQRLDMFRSCLPSRYPICGLFEVIPDNCSSMEFAIPRSTRQLHVQNLALSMQSSPLCRASRPTSRFQG